MSGNAERFVALLVGIVAILGGIGAMLRVLIRISWRMGELVTRFGDHVRTSGDVHRDYEKRLRLLEDRTRRAR